jgi:hypothetical protein
MRVSQGFACEEIQGIFPIGGLTTKQKRKEKKKKKKTGQTTRTNQSHRSFWRCRAFIK